MIKSHAERFRNFHFLALPISPGLTDRAEIIDADLPGVARLGEWPNPLVVAELIGRSEAVFGHSYHLCITALASGVPVFTRLNLSTGKYTALQHFETIHALPPNGGEPDPEWMLARVGKTTPSDAARAAHRALGKHWDRIAAVLREGPAHTAPTLNRFWQSLPAVLENLAGREVKSVAQERAEIQARLDDVLKLLTRDRHA